MGAGAATRRASDPPRAKHAIAAQSFTCPSPARQIEPAPHPPASVIPTPNTRPPPSAPAPAAGKTHSLLSLRSVNLRIANPTVLLTSANAAARVCSAAPVMNGPRDTRPERKRARRREEAADVAAEGEDGADAHQEPPEGALHELAPRRHAHRELARQQRGHEAAQEDARVQQRPRVEPRGQEIGTAHDPEARQHPVPPVPHAVRRGPRPVKGEEEDVDRGDENGGTPDGPRAAEEDRVLRREGAAHASAVTWSAARRTGRRPPTPPARRSGAPTASRMPRGPPSSPGRSPAARSSRRAGPS